MLEFGGKVIHVDPWSKGDFTGFPPADLIVITHTHQDHLDRTMVDKLKKPETIIVGPPAVIDTLNCAPACGIAEAIGDSEHRTVMGIDIRGRADVQPGVSARGRENRITTRELEADTF